MEDKLSIYVPQDKREHKPLERLHQLAEEQDRSVNYLATKALMEFVEREEQKDQTKG